MTAREKFKVGDRVRLSAAGLRHSPRSRGRRGAVVGFGRGPWSRPRADLVRVRWDAQRGTQTYACSFVELDDPGFDPLYLGM